MATSKLTTIQKKVTNRILSSSIKNKGNLLMFESKEHRSVYRVDYETSSADIIQLYSSKDTVLKRDNILDALAKLNNIEAALAFFKQKEHPLGEHISQRITELQRLYYDDEEEQVSFGSLKSMLLFLLILNSFTCPSITLNEDGLFHTSWRRDHKNLMTLRFREGNFLDYVIFKPSHHTEKPIVLNGNMHLFDFIDYLKQLGLSIHLNSRKI
jgi:hypothetical protein